MDISNKAIYFDFQCTRLLNELSKIHGNKSLLTRVEIKLNDDLYTYLMEGFKELQEKIAHLRVSGYFNELELVSYETMLWNCYIDVLNDVINIINNDLSIAAVANQITPNCLEQSKNIFDNIRAFKHSNISISEARGNAIKTEDRLRNSSISIFNEIMEVASCFKYAQSKKIQDNQEMLSEQLSHKNYQRLTEIINSKVHEFDIEFNRMHSNFDEKKKQQDNYFDSISNKIGHKVEFLDKKSIEIDKRSDEIMNIYNSCVEKMKHIDGILIGVNQEGMAHAFQKRHDHLKLPSIMWMSLFAISLILLAISGWLVLEISFSSTDSKISEVLSKIAVSLPLVWLAWFSAKQYNHISRLSEDYAYKVAVAMAYNGYKEIASEVGSEMSKKLLENTIMHFADNPVRLYENDNSASIVEALIKNNKVSDVINAARGK